MKPIFAVSVFSLALAGCNVATENDGRGEVTLAFDTTANTTTRSIERTTTEPMSVNVIDTSGQVSGSLSLDTAWIVLQAIELEHESDDDTVPESDVEIEFVGPFALDLLTGTTYPALPKVSIDTGTYNDIEFDVERLQQADLVGMPNLPQSAAESLVEAAIVLEGSYTSADGTTHVNIPFTLKYQISEEFALTGTAYSKGFVVDDTGLNDVLVAFRANEWFRFDMAETNPDGVNFEDAIQPGANEIFLGVDSDMEVAEVIQENMEESAEYGEDLDDDGELDEDEDDDQD